MSRRNNGFAANVPNEPHARSQDSDPHVPPADENYPDRYELFLVPEGSKKITEKIDTRIPNASTFTILGEDHTLANLIRGQLLLSPHVLFSGYKVPHPLEAKVELRVQTDGELTPKQAVVQASNECMRDLGILSREFTKEWELKRMVGEGPGNATDRGDGAF